METNESIEVTVDYESQFLAGGCAPPARFGKPAYIRREYRGRISQTVSVTGKNRVSIYEYIDNVPAHHFDSFQDETAKSFKKNSFFRQNAMGI